MHTYFAVEYKTNQTATKVAQCEYRMILTYVHIDITFRYLFHIVVFQEKVYFNIHQSQNKTTFCQTIFLSEEIYI